MKFLGNVLALILWGFLIASGFWIWNQLADRWATPALDAYMDKRKALKEAKAPAVQE